MKKITLCLTLLLSFLSSYLGAQSQQKLSGSDLETVTEISNESISTLNSNQEGLVFKVQFLISKTKLQPNDARFKKLGNIYSYQDNGLTKYVWGKTKLRNEASRLKRELHKMGFNDAFIVYFYNGKRISLQEAERLMRSK